METIMHRIKKKRLEFNYTLRSLATALKVSHSTISQWERGAAEPSSKSLIGLAELFKTSPEWFTHGEGNKEIYRSGYKLSKVISFYNSSDIGIIPTEVLNNRKVTKVKRYKMNGDSMTPYINKGSIIAIETTEKHIIDGGIYLFKYGLIERIRQITTNSNNINLLSCNNNYEDETINLKEIQIIGKIFWISNVLD